MSTADLVDLHGEALQSIRCRWRPDRGLWRAHWALPADFAPTATRGGWPLRS